MEIYNPWETNSPESSWTAIYSPAFTDAWLEPMAAHQDVRLYRLRPKPRVTSSIALASIPLRPGLKNMSVSPGQLYEIRLTGLPAATSAADELDLAWYDHAGQLVLFQPHPLPQGPAGAWHRWLQSAPPYCTRLDLQVRVAEDHPNIEIEVSALLPDHGPP